MWVAANRKGEHVATVFVGPDAHRERAMEALRGLLCALDPAPKLSVSRGGTSGASAG